MSLAITRQANANPGYHAIKSIAHSFLFTMSKRKKQRKNSGKLQSQAETPDIRSAEHSKTDKPANKKSTTSIRGKKPSSNKSMLTRRNAIRLLIALPVAGAAGAAIHRYDVQNKGLHDLTSIGQGKPVVVQIHDPKCQLCRRLMNNTRKALQSRDGVLFRVADISSGDGLQFQRQHHAETISLLLFNAKGKRVDTIQGVTPVSELESRFASLN